MHIRDYPVKETSQTRLMIHSDPQTFWSTLVVIGGMVETTKKKFRVTEEADHLNNYTVYCTSVSGNKS